MEVKFLDYKSAMEEYLSGAILEVLVGVLLIVFAWENTDRT